MPSKTGSSLRMLIIASEKGSLINFRGDLIRDLVRRGLDVYAAAPELSAGTKEADDLTGLGAMPVEIFHLRRSAVSILSDLRAFIALFRLMRRIRPNIVLAYTAKPVIYGLLAARVARTPKRVALITGLGYSFIEAGDEDIQRRVVNRIVRLLYRISLAGAMKILFQNPDDRDCFLAQGVIAPAAATFVINGSGVSLKKFPSRPVPRGHLGFLMVARILRDKGVLEYIAAGASLKRAFPEIDIVLAGPFDPNPGAIAPEQLEVQLRDSGVSYLGLVSNVHALLAACHVYVLPSYREGTPRTVLEAMAVGRPIITTDVPGCRETVEDGFNGFLVSRGSSQALEAAMRKFVRNPALVEEMGAHSLQVAREKYDVEKVNISILEAIGI